ncbi:GT2D2 protein, partial [Polyodon spathula]|nr:GT2D2 protein [Polyodon spathula]
MFKMAKSESGAAVKASQLVSELIAKLSKHFSGGAFVKDCSMLKVTEIVCPEKARVRLERSQRFCSFFSAVNESTDIADTAALSIFIWGVDADFTITQELLDVAAVHLTTTANNIFQQLEKCVRNMKLQWEK